MKYEFTSPDRSESSWLALDAVARDRIELETFSSNHRAIALYEKIGFATEGIKRKARLVDGTYDDFIIMGLLKEDI